MSETNGVDCLVMPEFGQKILVSQKYRRVKRGFKKEYVAEPFNAVGVFLGRRTITNGETDRDSEYGYSWMAKEHIRAALVAFSPNENPVYVPLDAIEA
jgi:hypothetical protein